MSEGVWLAVLVIIVLMALGIIRSLEKKEFTDEEFERGSKRPSLMRTGLQDLQDFLEPEKKAAVEVVEREKRKTDQTVPGDPRGKPRLQQSPPARKASGG